MDRLRQIYILFVLLATLAATGCQDDGGASDSGDFKSYWQDSIGLYYLDISGLGPISFVFPNKAATLSPKARIYVRSDSLILTDMGHKYVLQLNIHPSGMNNSRCMRMEDTDLCEMGRP